ncbi:MAG: hypothetical protein A2541_02190 [Candidatus Taylorbacteria bacterium RIFOXYD2_FULL_36_9]|uniref:Methyltransferase domain-containing protein n=1 Tax=Candidatus Taylorbacteria bacterium RIFOXYD2_FULL_36_9 TaxID=1802338 RepID=A0A1G2PGY1_9BACT|nr:MAG: hypothetical protein A2541_02190 [Candidatus Taylorbacteria bacterium RIFOXYD2_FULL_36_9]
MKNEISQKDQKVIEYLLSDDFDFLSKKIFSERELLKIAKIISEEKDESKKVIIFNLIDKISSYGKEYGWNVASILQHINSDLVITIFKNIQNIPRLYNSIGLSWLFGEFNRRDQFVVDYLYAVVNYSTNSDAWWRAAFSLENIDVEEAVNLLKRSLKVDKIKSLKYYLNNLYNKKSIIGVLVLSNVDNIQNTIYPEIKKVFFDSNDCGTLINCCWIIGRLNLVDKQIFEKLRKLVKHRNYELRYYTFFALQNSDIELLRPFLEKALLDKDPLIRKMACRSMRNMAEDDVLEKLFKMLDAETENSVISEISKTIYFLKNPSYKNKLSLEINSHKNENGLIIDESDKWYKDPAVYNMFSESEDPENICFDLVLRKLKNKNIVNPIDIATGTGRTLWQILKKINYEGRALGVDLSKGMCEFVQKNIKRERKYINKVSVVNSSIIKLPGVLKVKSNFVISSFGFPSHISDKDLCVNELKAIYKILRDDGIFVTIGWDETFNDELSNMWFRYIPDSIRAKNFDEWRTIRSEKISSPRNCNLTWFKRGIIVPLQFSSLKESVMVIGYLFGRDAAQNIICRNQRNWSMSMGITINTKEEIKLIIENYEKRS